MVKGHIDRAAPENLALVEEDYGRGSRRLVTVLVKATDQHSGRRTPPVSLSARHYRLGTF